MGEPDHGLTVDGPYEPDWWCQHGRSGPYGTTCPECHTTDPNQGEPA